MLACANISNRHNAIFGTDDLNHGMLKGAIMDSSVGGCANAIKRKDCMEKYRSYAETTTPRLSEMHTKYMEDPYWHTVVMHVCYYHTTHTDRKCGKGGSYTDTFTTTMRTCTQVLITGAGLQISRQNILGTNLNLWLIC